ncbi:hypothetical protein NEFER03_1036 [Nematocida sp. LUAm3]|nr:hypothetical protein NEFER03_1036 [Nematocida sp. LUAm3]KAI5175360.1 hypothetical protein NEFER02_1289 [Nematocida sp. LUAm2]KAI5177683.1 hypothetical protein NEFER01_0907 [Nematocida sp. LUAm1]
MNEELLQLNESTSNKYMKFFLANYVERKKEIEVLVMNMPQKHTIVNHIVEEIRKHIPDEDMEKQEIEILKSSSSSYFLLTNTILYLERRWNTKTITEILQKSLTPENFRILLPLVVDISEEEVDSECFVSPFALSLPEDFSQIEEISSTLSLLLSYNLIVSIRDTFTAYKIIQAYYTAPQLVVPELFTLVKLEDVNLKDIIGAILLGVLQTKTMPIYYANILTIMCNRNRTIFSSFVNLLVYICNERKELWDNIQNIVPCLYLNLKKEKDSLFSLLYSLKQKNALLLYESLNGDVPKLEVFDECEQAHTSLPSEKIRKEMQDILHIPHTETYSSSTPAKIIDTTLVFKPSMKKEEILDTLEEFFSFFITSTKPSFTHFNNYLREYKHLFKSLSDSQISYFVSLLLSSQNSLTYKELSVHMLYQVLHE